MKRKRILKWTLWGIGGFLILLTVLLIVCIIFLETVVKTGIETIGPALTKTSMTVGDIDIYLLRGRVELRDFVIGNPQGYSSADAIRVGLVNAELVPVSLFSSKTVVKELTVKNVRINYEQALTSNNLSTILNHLQSSTPGAAADGSPDPANENEQAVQEASATRFQIDKIDISDILFFISVKGVSQGAPIPVVPVYIENLGTSPEGASVAEISVSILLGILDGLRRSAGGSLMDLGDATADTAGQVFDSTKEAAKGLYQSIRGLFTDDTKVRKTTDTTDTDKAPAELPVPGSK